MSPLVVVIAAETVTDLHYALTECLHRAPTAATQRTDHTARRHGLSRRIGPRWTPPTGSPSPRERRGTPGGWLRR